MTKIGHGKRLQFLQLTLFVLIGVGCSSYLVVEVVGVNALRDPVEVTVVMDSASGLAARSPVTYNGVEVGRVESVRLRGPGGGARIEINLDADTRVPAGTDAMVAQDMAIALKHLDLRPTGSGPPFLEDGDVVKTKGPSGPVPLEALLTNLITFVDSVNLDDVHTIAEELSTGVRGLAGRLQRLIDNADRIITALHEMRPTIEEITAGAREFLGGADEAAGRLPRLVSALSHLTSELRALAPGLWSLLEQAPDLAEQVVPLLAKNQRGVAVLMSNLITPLQVIGARTPALRQLLNTLPEAFSELAGTVENGVAHLSLVTTQGPVCYYGTERRTPNQTAPRPPAVQYHCPGGQSHGSGVRAAANAPRPHTPQPAQPAPKQRENTTPPEAPDGNSNPPAPLPLPGDQSWPSIYLQGVR